MIRSTGRLFRLAVRRIASGDGVAWLARERRQSLLWPATLQRRTWRKMTLAPGFCLGMGPPRCCSRGTRGTALRFAPWGRGVRRSRCRAVPRPTRRKDSVHARLRVIPFCLSERQRNAAQPARTPVYLGRNSYLHCRGARAHVAARSDSSNSDLF